MLKSSPGNLLFTPREAGVADDGYRDPEPRHATKILLTGNYAINQVYFTSGDTPCACGCERKKEEKCSNRGHRLRVHARSRVFLVENRARGSFHFDILQLFVEIAYAQPGTFDSLTKTNCLFREFVDVVYTR